MKTAKLLALIFLSLCILSCASTEKKMQKELDKVYIGMPIEDFKKTIRKTSMVYLSDEYSCYKLRKRTARYGVPGGYLYSYRFFYFRKDKLWKIDEGERAVDYRIRVDDKP